MTKSPWNSAQRDHCDAASLEEDLDELAAHVRDRAPASPSGFYRSMTQRDIELAAALWLLEQEDPGFTHEQLCEFSEWLEESPHHRVVFAAMQITHDHARIVGEVVRSVRPRLLKVH